MCFYIQPVLYVFITVAIPSLLLPTQAIVVLSFSPPILRACVRAKQNISRTKTLNGAAVGNRAKPRDFSPDVAEELEQDPFSPDVKMSEGLRRKRVSIFGGSDAGEK